MKSLVEKPLPQEAPSNIAIMGRYVLTPNIFDILQTLPVGAGGEIQLTDAISKLSEKEEVLAYEFEGKRYDVGDRLGFIEATIEHALKDTDLKEPLEQYLVALMNNFSVKK